MPIPIVRVLDLTGFIDHDNGVGRGFEQRDEVFFK